MEALLRFIAGILQAVQSSPLGIVIAGAAVASAWYAGKSSKTAAEAKGDAKRSADASVRSADAAEKSAEIQAKQYEDSNRHVLVAELDYCLATEDVKDQLSLGENRIYKDRSAAALVLVCEVTNLGKTLHLQDASLSFDYDGKASMMDPIWFEPKPLAQNASAELRYWLPDSIVDMLRGNPEKLLVTLHFTLSEGEASPYGFLSKQRTRLQALARRYAEVYNNNRLGYKAKNASLQRKGQGL